MKLWIKPMSDRSRTAPMPVMMPTTRAIRQRVNRLTRRSSRAAVGADGRVVSAVVDDIFQLLSRI
jgi:hypothetical protein